MVEATELFNEVNGTKYDGIVTATETVAFYPEQIKSATDNIGTFDGSNPDIRYSVRYQQNASAAQLLRQENADMHTDVAGLLALADALRKQNKGKLPTAYLAEAVSYLKKTAGARGNSAELGSLLSDFYSYVTHNYDYTWEDIREQAKRLSLKKRNRQTFIEICRFLNYNAIFDTGCIGLQKLHY